MELKVESGLFDRELNAAIEWLARENKIQIEKDVNAHKETFFLFLRTCYY